jgi:hypothetical protein
VAAKTIIEICKTEGGHFLAALARGSVGEAKYTYKFSLKYTVWAIPTSHTTTHRDWSEGSTAALRVAGYMQATCRRHGRTWRGQRCRQGCRNWSVEVEGHRQGCRNWSVEVEGHRQGSRNWSGADGRFDRSGPPLTQGRTGDRALCLETAVFCPPGGRPFTQFLHPLGADGAAGRQGRTVLGRRGQSLPDVWAYLGVYDLPCPLCSSSSATRSAACTHTACLRGAAARRRGLAQGRASEGTATPKHTPIAAAYCCGWAHPSGLLTNPPAASSQPALTNPHPSRLLLQVPPVDLLDRFVDRDELLAGTCRKDIMDEEEGGDE